jgi:hypothetical protein
MVVRNAQLHANAAIRIPLLAKAVRKRQLPVLAKAVRKRQLRARALIRSKILAKEVM